MDTTTTKKTTQKPPKRRARIVVIKRLLRDGTMETITHKTYLPAKAND
jgi:hypothetical protein